MEGMTKFCRQARESLKKGWLPQMEKGWSKNLISATQQDDLKLFADAMLKQLGEEKYFLYTRGNIFVKNAADAFPKEGEWRETAKQLLTDNVVEQGEPAEEVIDS